MLKSFKYFLPYIFIVINLYAEGNIEKNYNINFLKNDYLDKISFLERRNKVNTIKCDDGVALFRENVLHYYKNKKWTQFDIPEFAKLDYYKKIFPNLKNKKLILGNTNVIFKNKLYVGWNFGEWGGLLLSFKLTSSKNKWISYDINKKEPVIKILLGGNKKNMYVSCGLEHLFSHRAIYKLSEKDRWQTIIHNQSKPIFLNNATKEAIV